MEKIRIILANRPQIMRELMRDIIERQHDMEIVGEVIDPLDVLLAVKETKPDVIIIALRNSERSGLVSHLFAECPNVTVLSLATQGDTAFIEQLCPWRKEIADLSETNILNALRHAIQEPYCSEDK